MTEAYDLTVFCVGTVAAVLMYVTGRGGCDSFILDRRW